MGTLIQFVPRPNPKADRAFWIGAEGKYWETVLDKPAGSYRGTYDGVPCFEVDDLTMKCADHSPSEMNPDKDRA